MEDTSERKPRLPKLWEASATLLFLIGALAIGIIVYGADPQIPMFLGTVGAALMALRLGYRWEDVEGAMLGGIGKALQSIIILICIGILTGVWINAGVVPAMIYYGLQILSPGIFFVGAVLICSVTSLATGSSWGTIGTMGVALMGIGYGLGMDPAMTAGAIISGAYFGDKLSPLSDTTNLAPAMAGTDVMTHVKFMLLPTVITYAAALAVFAFLGSLHHSSGTADMSTVNLLSGTLDEMFYISPLLLLPPVVVIVAVAKKVPAIPGIVLGILSGAVLGLLVQRDCTVGTLFTCGMSGFSCETGVAEIDRLLNSGGLMNMMFSISMTIIAMMFGGIMDETHQLAVIVDRLKRVVKTPVGLVAMTEGTCVVSNISMPEQYISLVLPGQMYAEEYRRRGLHPKVLSNALEGAGTVTSCLIPWNTCGVFIQDTLGVGVAEYGVWAVFNWLMPIMVIVMAYLGYTLADADGVSFARKRHTVQRKVRMQIRHHPA